MTCSKCGATLADNAQYCMQCGTPASTRDSGRNPIAARAFAGPALISGTLMGVLSSIPLVDCLCCAWLLGGGGFATWLVGRNAVPGIHLSLGDGAFAGVLAGVWGAIIRTLAFAVPLLFFPQFIQDQFAELEGLLSQYPELAGPAQEMITDLASGDLAVPLLLFTLISNLVVYGLFAMIGGILFVAIRRKSGPMLPEA